MRFFRPWVFWFVAIAAICAVGRRDYYPPPLRPLRLEVVFPTDRAGESEPLIVTGRVGEGDFISVDYGADGTVVFAYDSWATPALNSSPVKITPGQRQSLVIEMPSLWTLPGVLHREPPRVRITCDGREVLDAEAKYYLRRSTELWFGENPLGGTACGTTFHGRIFNAAGRLVRGDARACFTPTERIAGWLRWNSWQLVSLAALAFGLAYAWPRAGGRERWPRIAAAARAHRAFLLAAAPCVAAFWWMASYGTGRLVYAEAFGEFYDFQAVSLLQGRLDVPASAIGGEAFVFEGKYYGYFGPTPALLRLPLVIFDVGFAQLIRGYMLLEFAAALIAAYLLLCEATRLLRPAQPTPSAWAAAVLTLATGLGSTLFYLGSRPSIYHEAILCGAACGLFCAWAALRWLGAPDSRWWLGSLACGVLAVQARPPAGLFALMLLGLIALVNAWRDPRARSRFRALAVGGLCALGALSFHALGYLKFKNFEGAPLRLSIPYTSDPTRLTYVEGKSFHAANVPYGFYTYLVRAHFHFEGKFPWVFMGSDAPAPEFPRARIDLPDSTLALPYAMTALLLLATVGGVIAAAREPALRLPIGLVGLAVLPMALALFAAIATAQRYTGDFCPWLVAAGACGLAGIESLPPRALRVTRLALALAVLWGAALTFALTLRYQREIVWGVPEDARHAYAEFAKRVDALFARPR
ncbi:MAG: hypothetical protein RLZZ15_1744 [Verrucomicrobiota bacterium]|jgi:hypothetical protein